jgi:hypothetical protein
MADLTQREEEKAFADIGAACRLSAEAQHLDSRMRKTESDYKIRAEEQQKIMTERVEFVSCKLFNPVSLTVGKDVFTTFLEENIGIDILHDSPSMIAEQLVAHMRDSKDYEKKVFLDFFKSGPRDMFVTRFAPAPPSAPAPYVPIP